ncbi:putative hydro-lyase [Psychrosphaera aquimarina]|uniref:Putative hydro-lyase RT723_09490 n=1 Tax=Psychrosphaera aquimarina TaxID=2044854 RepID=A0ABU3R0N8_9GAMM|nr:putative hydro-lyase [Psychrosphaera aquimarina]MDU0113224.1 putative hydro-lyase [Psychrosphaera aquimarina]
MLEEMEPNTASPSQVRRFIRDGKWKNHTSGLANGYVQCNLVILPEPQANDFLRFCQLNPKSCPIIAMSTEVGSPYIDVGAEQPADIRFDIPKYNIFVDGELQTQVSNIDEYWRDDLVIFLLGCSFSFEEALLADGIEIRNITQNVNVPMYNTNIANVKAGELAGNLVVSMRPMLAKDAIRAVQICSRFPSVHGAPVHLGDPSLIGISHIDKPDYGDAVEIKENELPVFWACGVTPQNVIREAKLGFCITHSPGCMLVTDIKNSKLSVL